MAERDLSDYVEVAERIAAFRKEYPEGSLRPWDAAQPWRLVQAEGFEKNGELTHQTFIVVVAAAYRHGLDDNPGVGMAWEIFPGRTPYTRGSELQNAETSAWGRAIIAVGASDSKRGIASREEVRNRQAERESERCPGLNGFPCYLDAGHEGSHDSMPRNRDGSLSRSRTTDEEKAAAGVMTSGQQAEHTQLAKPPPNRGAAERLRTVPVEDPWTDTNPSGSGTSPRAASASGDGASEQAAGSGTTPEPDAHGTPIEDRPGTATTEQIQTIQGLYATQFHITDRDRKIETTRKFLGIDMLSSHTQLSYRQAGDLLLAMRTKLSAKAAR